MTLAEIVAEVSGLTRGERTWGRMVNEYFLREINKHRCMRCNLQLEAGAMAAVAVSGQRLRFWLWYWWKLAYNILVWQRAWGRSLLCVPSPRPLPRPPWEGGDSDTEDESGYDKVFPSPLPQGGCNGQGRGAPTRAAPPRAIVAEHVNHQ